MGKSGRLPAAVANIFLLICLAVIWVAFAPLKLGGQVSYVLVNGNSMEPGFHMGDLVIVRQSEAYQVGDVVTYYNAEMGSNVIHRIIDIEQDHFVIKGDNNSWIDGYRPTQDDIVGKLWIHLPKLGFFVQWGQLPAHMALITGMLGALMMVNFPRQNSRNKNKMKNDAGKNHAGMFEMALSVFGVLLLVFLALGIFAFTRPATRAADEIPYEQTGVFNYSAPGVPGVYDTDPIRSGEPLFTNLTCKLNLGLVYLLNAERLDNISGEQQLFASLLDDQTGWKHSFPLTNPAYFTGNTFTSLATIDLCQVQEMVTSVEQETGLRLNVQTLVIGARVSVNGKIWGQEFTDTFEPKFTFKFDRLHFYVAGSSSETSLLKTIQTDSINNPASVDNTFNLFGMQAKVKAVRTVTMVGLAASVSGLLALLFIFYSATKRGDQETVIRILYGSMLIDVDACNTEKPGPVIEVSKVEDLAKLAARQNVMIMRLARGPAHSYYVSVEGTTYRWTLKKDPIS